MSYVKDAEYVIESRWTKSGCDGPPDWMYNTTNVENSWWKVMFDNDQQLINGPPGVYYSNPGLCNAILYNHWPVKGFTSGFVSPLVKNEKEVIPRSTNGQYYCKIDGLHQNRTLYLLQGGPCFSSSFRCNSQKLEEYDGSQCTGNITEYPLTSFPRSIDSLDGPLNVSSVLMFGNTQDIVFTVHIPSQLFVPDLSRVSGQIILLTFLFYFCFCGISAGYYMYLAIKTKLSKYWLYSATMLARIIDRVSVAYLIFAVFEENEPIAIAEGVAGFLFAISTFVGTLMNCYNVVKFVFHGSLHAAIALYTTITLCFIGLGSPYVIMYWIVSPRHMDSSSEFFMNWMYFTKMYWALFTFCFNFFCCMVIILYIVNVKLRQSISKYRLKVLLKQKKFVLLVSGSCLVILLHLTLQLIKANTFLLKDDHSHTMVLIMLGGLVDINVFLSILFMDYYPELFQAICHKNILRRAEIQMTVFDSPVDAISPHAETLAETVRLKQKENFLED